VRRRLLLAAAVLVAAWLGACAFLFLWPREDSPRSADAIVVLAGDERRLDTALELVDRGVSRTLVISDPRDPDFEEAVALCTGTDERRRRLDVVCFRADPYSTRGEARAVARLARERGWRRVAVVTSTYHVFRSRLLLERCLDVDVAVTGAPYALTVVPRALVTETAKLVYALAFARSC
jgi:uncharacterized SAM-binding protein YcdF (DUF218 family)